MNNFKVSFVMGIYNCSKYLEESIESIVKQTYNDWELIMCDDGSSDETLKIAQSYSKKYYGKIIVLENEKNMGLNYTLNKCIKYSKGEYIARQDGDDISMLDRLEKQVRFLDNNREYALVGTDMIFFDSSGNWGTTNTVEKPRKDDFVKSTPFCHATCLIRRECLLRVDCYSISKKLLRVEDYHLWFKMYKAGMKGYNIKEKLYLMRDDRNAARRRNFKSRINEMRVKFIGFQMLKISLYKYIYLLKPIIIGMLPLALYDHLRKKNIIKKNRKKRENNEKN